MNFKEDVHIAEEKIEINPNLPIYAGLDFGLTPAAVFGQRTVLGKWNIIS